MSRFFQPVATTPLITDAPEIRSLQALEQNIAVFRAQTENLATAVRAAYHAVLKASEGDALAAAKALRDTLCAHDETETVQQEAHLLRHLASDIAVLLRDTTPGDTGFATGSAYQLNASAYYQKLRHWQNSLRVDASESCALQTAMASLRLAIASLDQAVAHPLFHYAYLEEPRPAYSPPTFKL